MKRTQILKFTVKELMDLYKKLQYKENPVWVMLRDKIDKQTTICPHCGQQRGLTDEDVSNWLNGDVTERIKNLPRL